MLDSIVAMALVVRAQAGLSPVTEQALFASQRASGRMETVVKIVERVVVSSRTAEDCNGKAVNW
jgi:flagellar hook-basal body complex protein FliE